MKHGTFKNMYDEMLENPDQLFITSNSKHAALISTEDGAMILIRGDFSGSPEEREAEARRIIGADPLNQADRKA